MFQRADCKKRARETMRGNWGVLLPVVVLIGIINVALDIASSSSETFNLADALLYLLEGPICICFFVFVLRLMRQGSATVQDFFAPFSNIIKWVLAGLWQSLWLVLWTLLFVIPGIVKIYSYSQYYFILADNPDADIQQALKTSIKMTRGYKGDLFLAVLSFLGWILAAGLLYEMVCELFLKTIGMGAYLLGALAAFPVVLYLIPYMVLTFANIYEALKAQAIASGVCSPDEFGIAAEQATVSLAEQKMDVAVEIERGDEYENQET